MMAGAGEVDAEIGAQAQHASQRAAVAALKRPGGPGSGSSSPRRRSRASRVALIPVATASSRSDRWTSRAQRHPREAHGVAGRSAGADALRRSIS